MRLTNEICNLERPFSGASVEQALEFLHTIADRLVTANADRSLVQNPLTLISRALRKQNIRFSRNRSSRCFTLSGTIADGRGNCLGLSTVYMSVAELLNIDVRPLLHEGHILIAQEINGIYQPFEVTRAHGVLGERTDLLMHSSIRLPQLLSDVQFIAVHKSNQAAFVSAPVRDFSTAQRLLEEATTAFPDYAGAWLNLAVLSLRTHETDKAVRCLKHVNELSPSGPYAVRARSILRHVAMYL